MLDSEWILFDTDSVSVRGNLWLCELAAQKMQGVEAVGGPFRALVKPPLDWLSGVSTGHGYSREVLERDGDSLADVLKRLSGWAGNRPLVAYHLELHLNDSLRPAWNECELDPHGVTGGVCLLRIAQRLLDSVMAGNCTLETLRKFYGLPVPVVTGCLANVHTAITLFSEVLYPMLKQRGPTEWSEIQAFCGEEWYPSKLVFGKHKGRSFLEAREDQALHQWLEWLSESSNAQSAAMGRWYLRALQESVSETMAFENGLERDEPKLVIYNDPRTQEMSQRVEHARQRLADLEASYTSMKCSVSALQAVVFKRLRPYFEKRDRLRLVVHYQCDYLQKLLTEGEHIAAKMQHAFRKAEAETKQEYENLGVEMNARRSLNHEEESELKKLWRDLVKVFHPDRYANDPERQATYTKLTGAINEAKENGDLETLRKIAEDPERYVLQQGWGVFDFLDDDSFEDLKKLLEKLESEILAVIEATESLMRSAAFKLFEASEKDSGELDRALCERIGALEKEIEELQGQAEKNNREIEDLGGEGSIVFE